MNLFELSRKSLFVMLLSMMALVMLPACSSTEETPATDTGTAPPAGEDTQPFSCDENDTEQQCKDQIM
jgi:hypothetical protein